MVRIMVVDDHPLMRQQLRRVIHERNSWEVCGEACDGREAISQHAGLNPHITLMDINMPCLSGLEASRSILENQPAALILMISVSDCKQMLEQMKQIGVKGFCSKDRTEDLVRAIEEVLQGETHFTEIQD